MAEISNVVSSLEDMQDKLWQKYRQLLRRFADESASDKDAKLLNGVARDLRLDPDSLTRDVETTSRIIALEADIEALREIDSLETKAAEADRRFLVYQEESRRTLRELKAAPQEIRAQIVTRQFAAKNARETLGELRKDHSRLFDNETAENTEGSDHE